MQYIAKVWHALPKQLKIFFEQLENNDRTRYEEETSIFNEWCKSNPHSQTPQKTKKGKFSKGNLQIINSSA